MRKRFQRVEVALEASVGNDDTAVAPDPAHDLMRRFELFERGAQFETRDAERLRERAFGADPLPRQQLTARDEQPDPVYDFLPRQPCAWRHP